MNERWRKMLGYGIVERTVTGVKPPVEVNYRLTAFGRRFLAILDEVRRLQEWVDAGLVPKEAGGPPPPARRGERPTPRRVDQCLSEQS